MVETNTNLLNEDQIEQTSEEQITATNKLKEHIQEEFLQLGQLLTEMKAKRVHEKKGYLSFKEFLEVEINFPLGSKLLGIYQLFINDLQIHEKLVEEIGFDKLNLIKSIVSNLNEEKIDEWMQNAKELSISELREEVKDYRAKNRDNTITFKDILKNQYLQQMTGFFDCNRGDLDFKLGLYFSDIHIDDLQLIKDKVVILEREFNEKHMGSVSEVEADQQIFGFADNSGIDPLAKYESNYRKLIKADLSIILAYPEKMQIILWSRNNPEGIIYDDDFFETKKALKDESERLRDENGYLLIDETGKLTTNRSIMNACDNNLTYITASEHEGIIKFKDKDNENFSHLQTDLLGEGQIQYAMNEYLSNEDHFTQPIGLPNIEHFLSGNPFEPTEEEG